MNKAKIKKHFKALLKKELEGRYKYITKPFQWGPQDYLNLDNEIFVGVDYYAYELTYYSGSSFVNIPRLGNYEQILFPVDISDEIYFNWFNCNTFTPGESPQIISEEKIEEYFYKTILPKVKEIHIPRGKRINTIADCYQLNMSGNFRFNIEFMHRHLIYAKLIDPKRGDHIETILKEEVLPQLGFVNHKNPKFYFEDERYGGRLKKICNLNQEEELESGRLLESDLVVTTKNEEWPSLDPEFKEGISPEYKELLYGK